MYFSTICFDIGVYLFSISKDVVYIIRHMVYIHRSQLFCFLIKWRLAVCGVTPGGKQVNNDLYSFVRRGEVYSTGVCNDTSAKYGFPLSPSGDRLFCPSAERIASSY